MLGDHHQGAGSSWARRWGAWVHNVSALLFEFAQLSSELDKRLSADDSARLDGTGDRLVVSTEPTGYPLRASAGDALAEVS